MRRAAVEQDDQTACAAGRFLFEFIKILIESAIFSTSESLGSIQM